MLMKQPKLIVIHNRIISLPSSIKMEIYVEQRERVRERDPSSSHPSSCKRRESLRFFNWGGNVFSVNPLNISTIDKVTLGFQKETINRSAVSLAAWVLNYKRLSASVPCPSHPLDASLSHTSGWSNSPVIKFCRWMNLFCKWYSTMELHW